MRNLRTSDRLMLKHHCYALALVAFCGTLLTLVYATAYHESLVFSGRESVWTRQLLPASIELWPLFVLTPLILHLCHRFRFERGSRTVALIVHTLAGLAYGTLKWQVKSMAYASLFDFELVLTGICPVLLESVVYWTFLAAFSGFAYYHRFRERELRTGQLEAQLARAKLEMLRMQLQPHFLFNTLHAISTLMQHDHEAADRMITRLSDLLRQTLEDRGRQEVSLRRELELLERYLEIEQIRFGARLEVSRRFSPELLEACVPNLILQPIVENAVHHGVSRIRTTGRIQLRGSRQGEQLYIEVEDNGPGLHFDDLDAMQSRTGLSNTISRLTQLYGPGGKIQFITPEAGGLLVRLALPFHTAPLQ